MRESRGNTERLTQGEIRGMMRLFAEAEDMTVAEVGAEYDVTERTVYRYAAKLGVKGAIRIGSNRAVRFNPGGRKRRVLGCGA